MAKPSKVGFARILGFRLYYEVYESRRARGTVLGLHGGPGGTHDYLHPVADLTRHGYRVVLFDQLGCGRSDLPENTRRYSISHNVREVETLRRALRLGRVHLLGSSYGGLLALAYALRHPSGVRSLVLTGGLANVPFARSEMLRLKSRLPVRIRRVMSRFERKGEYEHPEYEQAVAEFYRRHLIRLDPWPPDVAYTMAHLSKPVYYSMNGPNEFTITGRIRDVDLTSQLHRIRVPVLITGGRHDEVTPRVAQEMHRYIPNSRLETFERSAHLPMWEERRRYIATVGRFLRTVRDPIPPLRRHASAHSC